ncbi:neuronal acetylcholine receptor subunit alpha-9-like [Actinia tenebrosa]|uniref:Neuronal acetylcholine receptor subunit alpha-9-like n=1 Tax=Actinia tenebrosa TaxID=6105 RepID=A0A6P8IX84_ACTTE|nr:neuronal acetylcholine receptor subunit alpha-9-like [Actinia tenebrosa]XP_031571985.1 neuronal acetylcholine receptor subunit alpha-9-like [Actinia tenebrosa]XP_031571986.1 neuronal acetylcholine receptor subunit alpha-9-like [Actinia tenebrosa]
MFHLPQLCFVYGLLMIQECYGSRYERALLKKLLENYDKQERPVINDNDTVNVVFGMTLNQIIDVDEKNQILTASAWVRQTWYNPYLSWNLTKYGGLRTINIDPKVIWLPDIVLYDNADDDLSFSGNLDRLNTRVVLHYTGRNQWLAPVTFKSNCPINVKDFPFDTQYCNMKFGSWTYDGFRLNVMNESKEADLGKYMPSAEWHLVSVPAKRNVIKYFCCEEPYPDVTFTFILQRRSLFYMMNLILPLVTITILVNVSFVLPAESGERISLSITILLAMTVFMLVVAETIPPTSDAVPLIAKFYMAGMIEMAIALIWTCYILKYYHSDCMEMPSWVRKYILGYLGNFFGIRMENLKRFSEHSNLRKDGFQVKEEITFHSESPSKNFRKHKQNKLLKPEDHIESNDPFEHSRDSFKRNGYVSTSLRPLSSGNLEGMSDDSPNKPIFDLGEKILEKVETLVENSVVDDRVNIHKEEWRIAAMVMDKVSLWVFSLTVLITILSCFLQAPAYVA